MVRMAGVAVAFALAATSPPHTFDTRTASFAVAFHDDVSAYADTSVVVLPHGRVTLKAIDGPAGDYDARAADGALAKTGAREWRWDAPGRPGLYAITVQGPAGSEDAIVLHVFVLVPASEVRHGVLNGYRIGEYPAKPLNGNPIYLPPPGFIEVTRENQRTKISPHFTLQQFLCKEHTSNQYPKYVVLRERLPLTLEAILERVNALGLHVDTLHVMSAYRTPFYNHLIGDVLYSQHQWGSAADIFIDPDDRNRMDDLNGDGRVDVGDAKLLFDRIDALTSQPAARRFEGGLGFYRGTAAHPPFVHVDVRGVKARWHG